MNNSPTNNYTGKLTGDLAHPIPYCPEFFSIEFASAVADMKNSVACRTNAQASCAGMIETELLQCTAMSRSSRVGALNYYSMLQCCNYCCAGQFIGNHLEEFLSNGGKVCMYICWHHMMQHVLCNYLKYMLTNSHCNFGDILCKSR